MSSAIQGLSLHNNCFVHRFCLSLQGEPFLDPQTGTARAVAAEYAAARGDTWSSKDMLQLIRRKSQVRCGVTFRVEGLMLACPATVSAGLTAMLQRLVVLPLAWEFGVEGVRRCPRCQQDV
jgi:hypothetical protein